MRRRPRRTAGLLALLTVSTLNACSSDESAPAETTKAWDVAFAAAETAGAAPFMASGAEAWQSSPITVGPLTTDTTYGAFAACTGDGSLGLDLAGTAVTVNCDGQGHRVGELIPTTGDATFRSLTPTTAPRSGA
ncbi:hypothetical protein FHR75_004483 [Kineococcus radiotolerans]|uniref:Uncharacterized protein n=1 Tax=Kineococcus radiotolerans TaxID=131568 RepID=A0A7W4TRJ4_KINRA|nr:hypothetical protein [Kineococcus radiotolerans]MBB2903640.1 hypothetical protein [Kineococcus radiotolerans]